MSTLENGTGKTRKGGQQYRRKQKEYNEDEHYFTEKHEKAVVKYCNSDDEEERNRIYRETLSPVFSEMIRKIMRTYKYGSGLSNKEKACEECKSWIPTILDKYDPDKGSKAFTYFTVAIKNWFIQRIKDINKDKKRKHNYEDIPKQVEDQDLTTTNDYIEKKERREFIETFKEDIQEWDEGRRGELLGENDKKVVKALQIFFENPEDLDVLNKRGLYLYMREITDLNTKQISRSLKKLKKRYKKFKKRYEMGDYDEGEASIRKLHLDSD